MNKSCPDRKMALELGSMKRSLSPLLIFCSVLALSLSACTRADAVGDSPTLLLAMGDDPTADPRPAVPGQTVDVGPDGGYFWVIAQFPRWDYQGDSWLTVVRPSAVIEWWLDGVRMETIGQFSPLFIESGRASLFRIPGGLIPQGTVPDIKFRMYSDGGSTRLPDFRLTQDQAEVQRQGLYNWLSIDIYRYLAVMSFFMLVFFLAQFVQRPVETTNLYFALFNFFIGVYYLGLGNVNVGIPFQYSVGLTRACLFMACGAMVMFCLSFTKHPSRLLLVGSGALGLMIGLNLIFMSQTLVQARTLFNIALIPAMAMLGAALLYLFGLYRKGAHDLLPLLVGGVAALIAGLHDSAFAILSLKPWFWLQGFGIFIFLLSVFMTIVNRTTHMHQELEGYARGIEAEVDRRTSELHETNIALSKANTAKSDFLAHMSHEIRTPLNCIMGFAQIMEQHDLNPEDQRNIRLILREAEHLMQLINHILDFSRIEKGKLELDKQPFPLKESIRRVVDGFSSAAGAKGLAIELSGTERLPDKAVGDMLRFQQILINLIGNAVKFTERGRIAIGMSAEAIPDRGQTDIRITIRDTGIGIPPERLGAIFNGFEQADTSITRRFGGSGLGITIARDLILLMDGSIDVQSHVGQGTTVEYTVRLGLAQASSVAELPGPLGKEKVDFGLVPTVLVVEDYESNLEVIRLFLGNAGVKVVEAVSGQQALDIMGSTSEKIDLILMDIHMPEMDGYETTIRLKKIPGAAEIPVVALTADAFDETARHCHEIGMVDVLTKPLRYPHLVACLQRWLGGAAKPQAGGMPDQKSAAATRHAEAQAVDYQNLREVFFDDEDVIQNLLAGYIESATNLIQEIKAGLEAQNLATVHLKAHALRGGALNICAERLAEEAEKLESMARVRQNYGLREQYEAMLKAWDDVREWWMAENARKAQGSVKA